MKKNKQALEIKIGDQDIAWRSMGRRRYRELGNYTRQSSKLQCAYAKEDKASTGNILQNLKHSASVQYSSSYSTRLIFTYYMARAKH